MILKLTTHFNFNNNNNNTHIGDRKKLPRGYLTSGYAGDKDPNAFRSIHLGGDDQAKIIEQAAIKEKEDWLSKVVVDSLSVKIGNTNTNME